MLLVIKSHYHLLSSLFEMSQRFLAKPGSTTTESMIRVTDFIRDLNKGAP